MYLNYVHCASREDKRYRGACMLLVRTFVNVNLVLRIHSEVAHTILCFGELLHPLSINLSVFV